MICTCDGGGSIEHEHTDARCTGGHTTDCPTPPGCVLCQSGPPHSPNEHF